MPEVPASTLADIGKGRKNADAIRAKCEAALVEKDVLSYGFSYKALHDVLVEVLGNNLDADKVLAGCITSFTEKEAKAAISELNETIADAFASSSVRTLEYTNPFERDRVYMYNPTAKSYSFSKDKAKEALAAKELQCPTCGTQVPIPAIVIAEAFTSAESHGSYVNLTGRDKKEAKV